MEDPTEKHISDVGILNKYDYYYNMSCTVALNLINPPN